MSTLIINASPRSNENSGAFLENCKRELLGWNESYDIIDLNDEQVHDTNGSDMSSTKVQTYQNMISKSERLVFIYEIWKDNLPGILEGFIENVFTNGFAFKDSELTHEGLLKNKQATVFAYSSKKAFLESIIPYDHGVKFLTDDILKYCEIKATPYVLVDAMKFNDKLKNKIRHITEKGIDHLFKRSA